MLAVVDRDALQQQINTIREESNVIREESNANRQQMAALFEQGLAQVRDQIAQITQGQAQLGGQIAQIAQGQEQLGGQIAELSELAPLRYPATIPNDHILPATRRHLSAFTGKSNQLQAASQALGLPALPANTLVEYRKRQIADYIGVPY
ncbi:hypothetical protein DFP73DRAFT_631020 [Morchella snyderi]|nr:hypothetical protein DFP73DRAFT_631020 [Morchella snyderi]